MNRSPELLALHRWPSPIVASRRRLQLALQTGHAASPGAPCAPIAGAVVPGAAPLAKGRVWRVLALRAAVRGLASLGSGARKPHAILKFQNPITSIRGI
jgi:hypothetical protein